MSVRTSLAVGVSSSDRPRSMISCGSLPGRRRHGGPAGSAGGQEVRQRQGRSGNFLSKTISIASVTSSAASMGVNVVYTADDTHQTSGVVHDGKPFDLVAGHGTGCLHDRPLRSRRDGRAGHQPLGGQRVGLGTFRGQQVRRGQMSARIRLTLLCAQQVRLRHHADRAVLVVDDRYCRDVVLRELSPRTVPARVTPGTWHSAPPQTPVGLGRSALLPFCRGASIADLPFRLPV